MTSFMKTVAKINPELEHEKALKLISLSVDQSLGKENASSLSSSVDCLMTATRILIEREDRRRGKPSPKKYPKKKGRKKGSKRSKTDKLPSERYPEIEVREKVVLPEEIPSCPCCNKTMSESGR